MGVLFESVGLLLVLLLMLPFSVLFSTFSGGAHTRQDVFALSTGQHNKPMGDDKLGSLVGLFISTPVCDFVEDLAVS